jgi:ABC-type transport system involved in multi-copper enzyme maturation permease subunit
MRALIVKDLRFFRVPMIGLLIVVVSCYVLAMLANIDFAHNGDGISLRILIPYDTPAVAAGLTALMASAFGGLALAGERKDRSAEFVALLPIRRWQIMLSKWVVGGCILFGCASVFGFLGRLIELSNQWVVDADSILAQLGLWFGFTLCFFGIAWFFGSFSNSAVISTCVAIAATIALSVLVESISHHGETFGLNRALALERALTVVTMCAGLLSLCAGTVNYLLRVDP